MSDDRPIVYREGNRTYFRASGGGSCVRALVAAALGYEPSRSNYAGGILEDAAREGNLHEGAVLEYLREMGHTIDESQTLLEARIVGRCYVRGHIDGRGRPPGTRKDRGYEIKSMSKARFQRWESYGTMLDALRSDEFAKYGWQVSIYMHITGLPFVYVVKNRDSGKVRVEELTKLPVPIEQIKAKVKEVEKWRVKGTLPPCDTTEGKFFCAYPYLHEDDLGVENEAGEVVDDLDTAFLLPMLDRRAELTETIRRGEVADAERKDLNKKIVQTVGGVGVKRQVGKWGITVSERESRGRLSAHLLHEVISGMGYEGDLSQLEDAIKKSTKGSKYVRLDVRDKGDK